MKAPAILVHSDQIRLEDMHRERGELRVIKLLIELADDFPPIMAKLKQTNDFPRPIAGGVEVRRLESDPNLTSNGVRHDRYQSRTRHAEIGQLCRAGSSVELARRTG